MVEDVRPPCEMMVNRILPHLRGEIVKILLTKYGMRQIDIAEVMGLTQASVSQYINRNRGKANLLEEVFPEIKIYARESAKEIVEGIVRHGKKNGSNAIICHKCRKIRDNNNFRKYIMELNRLKESRMENNLRGSSKSY